METLRHTNTEEIAALLIGRSITDVVNENFILDDGTKLQVVPNEGCGGCISGYYSVDFMNKVDNVITNVTFSEDYEERYRTVYTINVYTEGTYSENGEPLLSVSGSDGNGYYGTGYRINVSFAK